MRIVWITDMAPSGYRNVSTPLCVRLAEAGHEIKVLGFGYRREEHWFPFSIIPCTGFTHVAAMGINLKNIWAFDLMIVALDISFQTKIMKAFQNREWRYWGIFPVESRPLSLSWAFDLMQMDRQFIISEFGTLEAQKRDVPATYLPVGIDTEAWRIPSAEERDALRGSYGLVDNEFTILTVADNQERKFLSRTAQIVREYKVASGIPTRWILVTREHLEVGWNINDLLTEFGLRNDTIVIERGIPFRELWGLYAMSDCFLLTSKTEGLGMPVLEAMSAGLPVCATNCSGLKDAMDNGRGFPIEPEELEAPHIDPFGNSYRYFASVKDGARQLANIQEGMGTEAVIHNARGYVETLTYDRSANVLLAAIENDS
jgi:glycosyltransferase involved in cell wall biosynthesis